MTDEERAVLKKKMQERASLNEQSYEYDLAVGTRGNNKIKMIVGIVLVVLVIVCVASFGIVQHRNKEYYDNIELAVETMLSGVSDAETSGNLIKQVWSDAIYKNRRDTTVKYTCTDENHIKFVSDFNEALKNLFADVEFSADIDSIRANQITVGGLMKELKNPPSKYKEAHNALMDLYDEYVSLTNCVVSPSGSLQTYSNTFNDADTKTVNAYNKMEMYLK